MGKRKFGYQRILSVVLVMLLMIGMLPTIALGASPRLAEAGAAAAEETLEISKVDQNNLAAPMALGKEGVKAVDVLTTARDFNGTAGSEEAAYVEAVAASLTEKIGVDGVGELAADETVSVIVWLTELPVALDRVYQAEKMNVAGYAAAAADAKAARTSIKALNKARAPGFALNYEYAEVFSGFSVDVNKTQLEQLAALPGVYRITEVGTYQMDAYTPDPTYTTPGNATARELMNIGALHTQEIDGRGVKVGVIDSGIDATHPDLVGTFVKGYNFTTDRYTGKSNDMSRPDGDHGTHVSGTIASQGVRSLGMAPGVELYMAQVFTADRTNSAREDDVLGAMEAFSGGTGVSGLPKVDVVNMSMGSNVNTAYGGAEAFAINNAVINGVIFVNSAGNNAYPDTAPTQRNAYSLGTPGNTSLSITVAASQYGGNALTTYNGTVSGAASGTMAISAENGDRSLSGVFADGAFVGTNAPVYVEGKGYELFYACTSTADMSAAEMTALGQVPAGSLTGKILVVNRGQAFADYKIQAVRTGASGLIILNRDESFIGNLDIGSETASADLVIFSGKVSGRQVMLDALAGGATAYLAPGVVGKTQHLLEPTGFSSIGPVTETAHIKPDVIAPGYAILSTSVEVNYPAANTSTYVEMGGTSMSTPCVAGLMALLRQAFPSDTPQQLKARLMNTANPFLIGPNTGNLADSGQYYSNPAAKQISVWEQGAGFVNPYRAIKGANTYITVANTIPTGEANKNTMAATLASFSFGNAGAGTTTNKLTATVSGAAEYDVSVIYNNDTRYSRSSEGAVEVKYEITGNTFDVWLVIDEDAPAEVLTGNLFEGYIVVTVGTEKYHLPWGVRVGETPGVDEGGGWLLFPDRPIQATYNHANQDWSPYSAQNYLFFGFDDVALADSVVVRRSGTNNYMDILLINVNNPDVPAYRYQLSLGATAAAQPLSYFLDIDGGLYQTATAARAYARNANGTWGTTVTNIAAGSYYIGLEFRESPTETYYNYYLQLGVTFSSTRPTLTIHDVTTNATGTELGDVTLTANTSTYGLYKNGADTYTVSGTIYSSAIAEASMAGRTGFYWAGYYLLVFDAIIELAQDLNILEEGQYGVPFEFGGTPWICDLDGNFELTFDAPADKGNAYLLNYNLNTTTGDITFAPDGTRHNAKGADAFDATLYTGAAFATVGNLTTFTWTPYVREAEKEPIYLDISADETGTIDAPVAYTLSLENAEKVMNVNITFEVDGSMLSYRDLEILLADFSAINSNGVVRWTQKDDNIWQGNLLLMYLGGEEGFTSAAKVDLAKVLYDARKYGDAAMKITKFTVTGLDEDGVGTFLNGAIRQDEATTAIVKIYNKYDLNKDDVIDERDLAMAQRYYGAKVGDENWAAASVCDFNDDGVVDMIDLVNLFLNFT